MSIKTVTKLDRQQLLEMEELSKNASELRELTETDCIDKEDVYCSDHDIVSWVLAYEDNLLIGKAAVFSREITTIIKPIRLGGIGKLKVRDTHRRKGVATKIIAQCMNILRDAACDLAFLGTDVDNPVLVNFYSKFGFHLLGSAYAFTGLSGKRYFWDDGMIAPIGSQTICNHFISGIEILDLESGNW